MSYILIKPITNTISIWCKQSKEQFFLQPFSAKLPYRKYDSYTKYCQTAYVTYLPSLIISSNFQNIHKISMKMLRFFLCKFLLYGDCFL